jgi:hypothetical protein
MVIHPRARSETAETTADKQKATHTCHAAGRWTFLHLVSTTQYCAPFNMCMGACWAGIGTHRHDDRRHARLVDRVLSVLLYGDEDGSVTSEVECLGDEAPCRLDLAFQHRNHDGLRLRGALLHEHVAALTAGACKSAGQGAATAARGETRMRMWGGIQRHKKHQSGQHARDRAEDHEHVVRLHN